MVFSIVFLSFLHITSVFISTAEVKFLDQANDELISFIAPTRKLSSCLKIYQLCLLHRNTTLTSSISSPSPLAPSFFPPLPPLLSAFPSVYPPVHLPPPHVTDVWTTTLPTFHPIILLSHKHDVLSPL